MRRALALGLVLLAGCGADDPAPRTSAPSTSPATKQPPGAVVHVAAIGDSITAGYPLWDPSPELRRQLPATADPRSQYGYWAERRLGKRVRFSNCGWSGARTDEIAWHFDDCVDRADVVIVQGGINDLVQGRFVAGIARNLQSMVRRGKSLGLEVLVAEVLPVGGDEDAFVGRITALNQRIHAIAREESVGVLRWYSVLEDPDFRGALDPEYTTDGLHPTIEGYRKLGEAVELP